jgi:hypothetical protein
MVAAFDTMLAVLGNFMPIDLCQLNFVPVFRLGRERGKERKKKRKKEREKREPEKESERVYERDLCQLHR